MDVNKEVNVENPSTEKPELEIDVKSTEQVEEEVKEEETKDTTEDVATEPEVEKETEEVEVQEETTPSEPKTFTQQELDEIVVTRLAKERQRFIKKLGLEDESQLDDYVKKAKSYDELLKENLTLKSEKERVEATSILNNLGVDPDFIEFVFTNVEKGENFEKNAKAFLEKHPKMMRENYQSVNSSLGLSGGSAPDIESMSTEEYLKWRSQNKL